MTAREMSPDDGSAIVAQLLLSTMPPSSASAPCLRCAVPARDPWTGAPDIGFAERFKPAYRVAVNTRRDTAAPDGGRTIRVGDRLRLARPG